MKVKYWPELIFDIKKQSPIYAKYIHQCPVCLYSLIKEINMKINCYGGELILFDHASPHEVEIYKAKYDSEHAHDVTLMICERIPEEYKGKELVWER